LHEGLKNLDETWKEMWI